MERLIADKEQDKQRGAAEFIAGVIGGMFSTTYGEPSNNQINGSTGSKHWPMSKQSRLWEWFTPFIKEIFKNIKTDTLSIWTSFLEVRRKAALM